MRPERQDIAAPELPPRTRWLGGEPASVSELTARGPVLVHFFDFAQLNSVRALPYRIGWDRRYRELGLTTLGVHSPRHPFTAPVEGYAESTVERRAVAYLVSSPRDGSAGLRLTHRMCPEIASRAADARLRLSSMRSLTARHTAREGRV